MSARETRLTLFSSLEPTYSVSQLCGEVRDFLAEAFSSVWVVGEAQRVRPSARGHVYFELVEKGERDEIVGKLDAVIWKGDFLKVQRLLAASDQRLVDGVQIRCRGSLDFYAPAGRLQLCVREVDPAFTLGQMERRRRETLAALAAAGLLERNQGLALSDLPLSIALITSEGSAAYHDFLSGLAESGFGFRVLFIHAAMQGRDAEREVVSALAALAGLAVDAAVLIRGGGSRTDLAAFDSRAIAEAVARAPFPVLTGLGHEIDRAIADIVAHTAFKTPTKVAEFLVERMARAEQMLEDLRRTLLREALEPLRAGREALGRAERGVSLARMRLAAAGARIEEHARALGRLGRGVLRDAGRRQDGLRGRLADLAPRLLGAAGRERVRRGERLAAAARGRVREAAVMLAGMERLCQQLAPERTLERGFSLTRDAAGKAVRHPGQVRPGDVVATRVAGGDFKSRVEDR
ncbi:MAG TPA: exodeoxyribonuclease VII large subunit [Thermoanaerobaculia bacterium]|jgi:exodeoxyribonuclease VII large subunit|nr:exodeoxyribonuclease VII large subunit [Thermoanaerobaculia bacterium]